MLANLSTNDTCCMSLTSFAHLRLQRHWTRDNHWFFNPWSNLSLPWIKSSPFRAYDKVLGRRLHQSRWVCRRRPSRKQRQTRRGQRGHGTATLWSKRRVLCAWCILACMLCAHGVQTIHCHSSTSSLPCYVTHITFLVTITLSVR